MSMDLARVAERARDLLTRPRVTWPVIAAEATTPDALYRDYIAIVAAIPPVAAFLKGSVLGYGTVFGASIRVGFVPGLGALLVSYLLTLIAVYAAALAIETLAPGFEGRRDRLLALKLAGYGCTAAFVGGAAVILPVVGGLVHWAFLAYGFYVFHLGAQSLLGMTRDRAVPFTILFALILILLGSIVARLATLFAGPLFPFGGLGP